MLHEQYHIINCKNMYSLGTFLSSLLSVWVNYNMHITEEREGIMFLQTTTVQNSFQEALIQKRGTHTHHYQPTLHPHLIM